MVVAIQINFEMILVCLQLMAEEENFVIPHKVVGAGTQMSKLVVRELLVEKLLSEELLVEELLVGVLLAEENFS